MARVLKLPMKLQFYPQHWTKMFDCQFLFRFSSILFGLVDYGAVILGQWGGRQLVPTHDPSLVELDCNFIELQSTIQHHAYKMMYFFSTPCLETMIKALILVYISTFGGGTP